MKPTMALKFELLYVTVMEADVLKTVRLVLYTKPTATAIPEEPVPMEMLKFMLEFYINAWGEDVTPTKIPHLLYIGKATTDDSLKDATWSWVMSEAPIMHPTPLALLLRPIVEET